ncbi:MAG: DUF2946 family protein [Quisquiliibacterium sp.]
MDDAVLRAMERWPQVPAVYGWLRLDRRGHWLLVDRAKPGFDQARDGGGSRITNPQILDFIARNYQPDAQGRWFWQNGPQRVFVDLELAPLILRVLGSGTQACLVTHTGVQISHVQQAWLTRRGDLMLATDAGPGAVHDLDLGSLDLGDENPEGFPSNLKILGRKLPIDRSAGRLAPFDPQPRPGD